MTQCSVMQILGACLLAVALVACGGDDPSCPDIDGDGFCDAFDLCPGSDDGLDADGDGNPDGCDVCAGDDRIDADEDGVPDACDICAAGDDGLDLDGDGVPDACDVCATGSDAVDADDDGVADACDRCEGFDDRDDADGDGVPTGCDRCDMGDDAADADNDGTPDACDVCEGFDDARDTDGDAIPNGCDICEGADSDGDGDGVADACDICEGFPDGADADGDGIPDGCDVCAAGPDGVDADGDGVADACDLCSGFDDGTDADEDGIPDACDLCPGEDDGQDVDGDGVPDACDVCTGDDSLDADGDGVPDECDACEGFDDGADVDGDGIPDGCDPCGIGRALAAGPVAYWRLGESGDDVTGNGNDGVLVAPAGLEGGVSEDGDPAVRIGLTGGSRFSAAPVQGFPEDAFTVMFWIRLTSASGARSPLYSYADGDTEHVLIQHDTTDNRGIVLQIGGEEVLSRSQLSTRYSHIAVSWDGATGRVEILHDGINTSGGTLAQGTRFPSAGSVAMGIRQLVLADQTDAVFDEVQVYDRVLSTEEIRSIRESYQCTVHSCMDALAADPSAASGVYFLDPGDGAFEPVAAYCDMETDGGGWMLVLNYLHQGGTNPPLRVMNNRMPLVGSTTLGVDESPNGIYFGHSILLRSFRAFIPFTEHRWYARTSAHDRVIHFATSSIVAMIYIRSGTGSVHSLLQGIRNPMFTRPLVGHTAHLPLALSSEEGFVDQGDFAATEFPIFGDSPDGRSHWGIRGAGGRWEVDDFSNGPQEDTHHQIWVR